MTRRRVRVSSAFFEQLDDQLPADRGPRGTPSTTDFIAVELPAVIERFATEFEELPEVIEGVSSLRMHITPGVLVKAMVVYGVLASDGAVDLVTISIEP